MRIVWTEVAELDLQDLFEHISRDSPIYAERFVDRIIEAVARLAEFPKIGRVVPEANSEFIRELTVQSQRVVYSVNEDTETISILALVHVRQDPGQI